MSAAVILATWRERLAHPLRLACMAGVLLLPLPTACIAIKPDWGASFPHVVFAVIVATGVIGFEVTAGTLALVFTRPIDRGRYALTKWIAVSMFAAALSLAQLGAFLVILGLRFGAVDAGKAFALAGERLLQCFGVSAVFVFFSVLGAGVVDLAAWAGIEIVAQSLRGAGAVLGDVRLTRAGGALHRIASPTVDFLAERGTVPSTQLLAYLLTIGVALSLAVFMLRRKELSYASG